MRSLLPDPLLVSQPLLYGPGEIFEPLDDGQESAVRQLNLFGGSILRGVDLKV